MRQVERGFTLLELMVVLVIMGIIISFAVLSIGTGSLERRVEQEGKRLIALIDLAGENSMLHGEEMGLYFGESYYQFESYADGQWLPYQKDKLFHRRSLPDQVVFELFLEDLPVELSDGGELSERLASDSDEPSQAHRPHLFILSSGERNSFELFLNKGEQKLYKVSGDLAGELSMKSVEQSDW
ncbi:MAG: type II secretion system minor pseudopilin GspH [Gammaproteobacteria bacterium]|nr:type II secretion system minor pseudopilin GspH [Gammaproteobacteria bacterium]